MIRNSLYDPNGTRLLSPQHWVREMKHKYKNVKYEGDDESITLRWDDSTTTIKYDDRGIADLTVNAVSLEEEDISKQKEGQLPRKITFKEDELWCLQCSHWSQLYQDKDPSLENKVASIPKTISMLQTDVKEQHDLLWYHNRFGHVSFQVLKSMAKSGVLPERLTRDRVPKCLACLRAKSKRRAWRTKLGKDRPIKTTCIQVKWYQ